MMYRCDRNGVTKQAELVEENKKAKTVTLQLEDGTFKAVSESTFKRWWKPVEAETETADAPQEEATQQEEVQTNDVQQDDDVAGDGTTYTEVMQDIVAGAEKKAEEAKKASKASKKADKKEKAEKSKREKKAKEDYTEVLKVYNGIDAYIEQEAGKLGMTNYIREKQPNFRHYKLANGSKVVFSVMVNRKGAILKTKSKLIGEELSNLDGMTTANHNFDKEYRFTGDLTTEDKKVINSILTALNNSSNTDTNTKQKKKKEKEVA